MVSSYCSPAPHNSQAKIHTSLFSSGTAIQTLYKQHACTQSTQLMESIILTGTTLKWQKPSRQWLKHDAQTMEKSITNRGAGMEVGAHLLSSKSPHKEHKPPDSVRRVALVGPHYCLWPPLLQTPNTLASSSAATAPAVWNENKAVWSGHTKWNNR